MAPCLSVTRRAFGATVGKPVKYAATPGHSSNLGRICLKHYLRFGEEVLTRRHFRKVFSLTLEMLRVMSRNCREWSYRSRTRSAQLCLSLERLNQLNCSFQNRITDIARPNFHFSKEKMNRKVRVRKWQQTITRY